MSTLTSCMIRDMRLAGLAEPTQSLYLRAVRQLAAYYTISPDRLTERNVENDIFYVRDELGVAKGTFASIFFALKFTVILRPEHRPHTAFEDLGSDAGEFFRCAARFSGRHVMSPGNGSAVPRLPPAAGFVTSPSQLSHAPETGAGTVSGGDRGSDEPRSFGFGSIDEALREARNSTGKRRGRPLRDIGSLSIAGAAG
jgi:hypothetical protein